MKIWVKSIKVWQYLFKADIILKGGQLLFIHEVLNRKKPCALPVPGTEATHSVKHTKPQSQKNGLLLHLVPLSTVKDAGLWERCSQTTLLTSLSSVIYFRGLMSHLALYQLTYCRHFLPEMPLWGWVQEVKMPDRTQLSTSDVLVCSQQSQSF